MIYTKLTKKAMNIAYEAHKDQMDQSGVRPALWLEMK